MTYKDYINIKKTDIKKKNKNKVIRYILIFICYVFSIFGYLFTKKEKSKFEIKSKNYTEINNKKQKLIQIKETLEEIEEASITRKLSKLEIKEVLKLEKILYTDFKKNTRLNNIKTEEEIEVEQCLNIINNIAVKEENLVSETKKEIIEQEKKIEKMPEIRDYKLEIETDVKEVKELLIEKKEILDEIVKIDYYNEIYMFHYKLNRIKKKLEYFELKYKKLKEIPEFNQIYSKIKNIDKYNLIKPKELEKLISEIELDIKSLEQVKKDISVKEEPPKEEKVKEKKEPEQQEKNIKFKSKELIENHLNKQEEDIKSIKNDLNKYNDEEKKPRLLKVLKIWTNNIFNFTLSLIPITILKNKLVGILTSTIMMNHSIKGMRKLLDDEYVFEYNYEDMLNTLDDDQSNTRNIKENCLSSLNEIDGFRKDLLKKYSINDKNVESLLYDLDSMEFSLVSQLENTISIEDEIIITKIKQKKLRRNKYDKY